MTEQAVPHRYLVFYGVDAAGVTALTNCTVTSPAPNCLQDRSDSTYIFANSGTPSAALVSQIHALGSSFKYAYAAQRPSDYLTKSLANISVWAAQQRDIVAASGADMWAFNELSSNTATSNTARAQFARFFSALYQPSNSYTAMRGVIFAIGLTNSKWSNWVGSNIAAFFTTVNNTSVLFVIEHYKTLQFVGVNTESFISDAYFSLHDGLAAGTTAEQSVANNKFTIILSAYDGPPTAKSGGTCAYVRNWAGADPRDTDPDGNAATPMPPVLRGSSSNNITHAARDYYAFLEKQAHLIRNHNGGRSRIGFAPVRLAHWTDGSHMAPMGMTQGRLNAAGSRIAMVFNWHYNGASQTAYLANAVNNGTINYVEYQNAIC